MSGPFQQLLNSPDTPAGTLLKSLVRMSDDAIRDGASCLTDEQVVRIREWIDHAISRRGVDAVFGLGALLHLFHVATAYGERGAQFDALLTDLGISKTKAYDSMSIYRCFRAVLANEPALLERFRLESLKLLGAKNAPEPARAEALERARQGERITIKLAQALIADYAPDSTPAEQEAAVVTVTTADVPPKPRRSPSKRPLWTFEGETISLVLNSHVPRTTIDPQLVIRDLQAAIDALRDQADGGAFHPDAA